MPYTYILECSDGSFYVGSTWDIERRLWQHNAGEGARYTKRRRPVALVYLEECPRIEDAYASEKQIQRWSHDKRLALIQGRATDLRALSVRRHRPPMGDS